MLARATFLSLVSLAATSWAGETTPERWADARLKIQDGLILWLDAAAIPKAASDAPKAGDPIDVWSDGSGNKLHVRQKVAAAQPTYQVRGGFHSVRFKGKQTHLTLTGADREFDQVTIFVVGASYSVPEWFSGFLALSAEDRNDYVSGLNFDQAAGSPQRVEVLNVEGIGAAGVANLLQEPFDYGAVARMCITSQAGVGGVQLRVNGKLQGKRDRGQQPIRMDRFVVGARYFNNAGPAKVAGFLDGEIAEVLVYDRVLTSEELLSVERYLQEKYGKVKPLPLPSGTTAGTQIERVKDAPAIQTLVPGFTVEQLPIELTNVNNLLYRRDGKLAALGYDGNVHLLSDTNGDGLEDKAGLFWESKGSLRAPIGMDLTPPGFKHGDGVLVAAKGKCVLIVDTDGDDRGDKEIVVAEGWNELPHGVDALGIAANPRDHSIYFGLGTTNFTAPYLIDAKGKASYSLKNERGTIIRIAPNLKSRDIVATGIRFPVGLRFNRAGDLFCSDQEGATWLANGNPFDELLHIEKGRHYGFPPRHPKHLPDVIDEPSLFDYSPQHQSTCGINFNDGDKRFGPVWWKNDLFVAGYSRGKLYRTKLAKTAAGYVAQNQIFACLNTLPSDMCVSPAGAMLVATHSGGPDWGSGPSGKGTLYKVSYTQPELPQPVLAWASGHREVRVEFDRPLEPAHLAGVSSAKIDYGRYVAAGDRFENVWPGYQVVQDQQRTSRFELPVLSAQVTPDRRTLILATEEHNEPATYAITLPGLGRAPRTREPLSQYPETHVQYSLSGVEARWKASDGSQTSSVTLPHVDFTVARAFTAHSTSHDAFWKVLKQPGELTLSTSLNLDHMLRPAVQPGATIDYELPPEEVTIELSSGMPMTLKLGGQGVETKSVQGRFVASLSHKGAARVPLEIVLTTGAWNADLALSWHTAEDKRPRALPLVRLQLPWTPAESASSKPVMRPSAADAPELAGGNWSRGKAVFFSEQAACSKCHAFQGQGAKIGPDLSNLPKRDYASVLRDITEPSFAINPDFISHVVALSDGRILTGTIRSDGDQLLIADTNGKVTPVPASEIDELRPTAQSIMPQGIPKQLGEARLRDLLVFLLADPPRMTDYGKGDPPKPRTRNEVDDILAGAPKTGDKPKAMKIVLVAGPKDHGPGEHDYPAWQKVWQRLLSMDETCTVETAQQWPSEEQLKSADVLVFYQQGKWTADRARDMDAFLGRGGGAVYIHYAVDGGTDAPGFAQRIGLAWQGGRSKFRHGPLDLGFDPAKDHPIARNFTKLHLHDESYWQLVGDPKKITLLATGPEDNAEQPLFWTMQPGKGRVFVSIPGHFSWSFDDPLFRVLLLRGIAWTAGEPVDRFNELVLPGARVE